MYFFLGLLEALLQQSEDINPKEEIDPGSRQEVGGHGIYKYTLPVLSRRPSSSLSPFFSTQLKHFLLSEDSADRSL